MRESYSPWRLRRPRAIGDVVAFSFFRPGAALQASEERLTIPCGCPPRRKKKEKATTSPFAPDRARRREGSVRWALVAPLWY